MLSSRACLQALACSPALPTFSGKPFEAMSLRVSICPKWVGYPSMWMYISLATFLHQPEADGGWLRRAAKPQWRHPLSAPTWLPLERPAACLWR